MKTPREVIEAFVRGHRGAPDPAPFAEGWRRGVATAGGGRGLSYAPVAARPAKPVPAAAQREPRRGRR